MMTLIGSDRESATHHAITRLRQHGIARPDKEVLFHPARKWRLDLAWLEFNIAIEIHGAVYEGRASSKSRCQLCGRGKDTRGRHTRGKGFENDRRKMNAAQALGWIVLEFSTQQITSDEFLSDVFEAIQFRTGVDFSNN